MISSFTQTSLHCRCTVANLLGSLAPFHSYSTPSHIWLRLRHEIANTVLTKIRIYKWKRPTYRHQLNSASQLRWCLRFINFVLLHGKLYMSKNAKPLILALSIVVFDFAKQPILSFPCCKITGVQLIVIPYINPLYYGHLISYSPREPLLGFTRNTQFE